MTRFKPLTWFILLQALALPVYSADVIKQSATEIEKGLTAIDQFNEGLLKDISCNGATEEKKRDCFEITDNFCSELWSKKNSGNMDVYDGKIRIGKSQKSTLDLRVLIDDNALISSLKKLPADSQAALGPAISELENALKNEEDTPAWYRLRSKAYINYEYAFNDLVDQRFEKNNPTLKVNKLNNFTADEKALYNQEVFKAKNEVTNAKYKEDPNWQRVERLFPVIQGKLLEEISKLKIPSERKKIMSEKVQSIKLSLPIKEPGVLVADDTCASTEFNAFFTSSTNRFTVCAGYFNSMQSDAGLMLTVAHEIGHSIDSNALSDFDWNKNSSVAKSKSPLLHAKGPVYKCEDWDKITNEIYEKPLAFSLKNTDPMEKLYSCFRSDDSLDEMNTESVSGAIKTMIKSFYGGIADSKNFVSLSEKWMTKDGKKVANEFYMRPDRIQLVSNGYDDKDEQRDPSEVEVFTQNFACLLKKEKLTDDQYADAPASVRSKIFETAVDQTMKMAQRQTEDFAQYCGRNCGFLAANNLSISTGEKNADWFSALVLPRMLESIPPEHRAEASALSTVDLCGGKVDAANFSKELLASQKKYSLQVHPDNRSRRISVYLPEAVKLINCQINETNSQEVPCNL